MGNFVKKERTKNVYDYILGFIYLHIIGGFIVTYNRLAGSTICLFSIVMIILSIKKYGEYHFPFTGNIKPLFKSYILITIICVFAQGYFRGQPIWGNEFLSFLSYHIVVSQFYLAFSLPLICFIDYRKFTFYIILKYASWFSIFFLLIICLDIQNILQRVVLKNNNDLMIEDAAEIFANLFSSVSFILLLGRYIQNKKRLIPIVLFGLASLFLTIIYARRGSALSISIVLAYSVYEYYRSIRLKYKLFLCAILFLTIISTSNNLLEKSQLYINNVSEKGFENTRQEVATYFEKDLFNSPDIIWGRGMNGQYYCPQTYHSKEGGYTHITYRHSIETGFYHLILKGGVIFAILHVLILFGAAWCGIIRSRNRILKLFSFWILLSLFELYPFGWPTFGLKFLLIWIGACFCLSKKFYMMNDKEICEYLKIE